VERQEYVKTAKKSIYAEDTHILKSVEAGRSQGSKREQVSKGHSLTEEHRHRDKVSMATQKES
jgi:hypothetical protein